jgi:hypothetical protein
MNHRRLSSCALGALLAAAATLPAQDQATTLLEAVRRADAIVVATVTAATDPSPDWHRLELRVERNLHGPLGSTFVLLEPAGACCGRSLFALQAGDRQLLFLNRRGAAWHPFGGGRGVLPAHPALLDHVAALLAATDDAARAALLAAHLDHDEPRIARDAALALASLPILPTGFDGKIAAELQRAVAAGQTTAPALLDLALRRGSQPLLATAVASYLETPRDDQARLLRDRLAVHAPGAVLDELLQRRDGEPTRQIRTAELLAALPAAETGPVLRNLLTGDAHPRAKLHLTEALLAAGHRAETLAEFVPAPVLRLAEERHRAPTRWRNLLETRR